MRVYRDDQKFLTFRINALLWAIVVVFVFLAGSFWVVQGVQAEKYRNLSEANALREIVTPAKRGLILDRTGQKILADNQPAYSLTLDRVVMRPLIKGDPTHREKVITFLANVLGVPPAEIEARFEKGKAIPFSNRASISAGGTPRTLARKVITFSRCVGSPLISGRITTRSRVRLYAGWLSARIFWPVRSRIS